MATTSTPLTPRQSATTTVDLRQLLSDYPDFRCTPGNCIVRMDKKPESIGSIHVPERSRDLNPEHDIAYMGTVLAMTPRKCDACQGSGRRGRTDLINPICHKCDGTGQFHEDFAVGSRVWVMLLLMDIDREYILTKNTRIYAREEDAKLHIEKARRCT